MHIGNHPNIRADDRQIPVISPGLPLNLQGLQTSSNALPSIPHLLSLSATLRALDVVPCGLSSTADAGAEVAYGGV